MPVDQLTERNRHGLLDHARLVHVAADLEQLGAFVLRIAEAREPGSAAPQDRRDDRDALDIVDGGRAAVEARTCRERRLQARLALLALEAFEHRRLFAADVGTRAAVNFNSTIAGIEDAYVVLLVGSNTRWEAPLVNTRLRKAQRKGAKIFGLGPEVDLGMKVAWIGNDLKLLGKLPKEVADAFAKAERPAVIVGAGALAANALGAALGLGKSLKLVRDGWNGFNVLHTSASRMAGLILGYAQKGGIADIDKAKPEVVLLLGADEVDPARFAGSFKVYIGHHGDNGARQADLVLPGAAYAEKHGTYVNTEGRVQRSERATFAPGEAREDWTIFRAVSDLFGSPLPFDRFDQLRAKMVAEYPQLGRDGLIAFDWSPPKLDAKAEGAVVYPIRDFYLTNAITRSSPTMHVCSEELVQGRRVQEAAE